MIVYFILLIIFILFLSLLLLGPFLFALVKVPNLLIIEYYSIFKMTCHQLPERSYFILGYQIPVCVRCTGIYTGLIIGMIIYPIFKKINSAKLPNLKYLLPFFLPLIIDGSSQLLNLYPSPHYVRFFTGVLASASMIFCIMPVAVSIFKDNIQKK